MRDVDSPRPTGRTACALIASSDRATAEWVAAALADAGVDVVATAATAVEAVASVVQLRPDVCLLDLRLDDDPLDAAEEILEALPATRVVVLSPTMNRDSFLDAVRAGAAGYVVHGPQHAPLVDAMREVMAGHSAVPPELLGALVDGFRSV